jgi:hypothetical protein
MRDRLPNITINIDISVENFINRLEQLAIDSGKFEVRKLSYGEERLLLNLRYQDPSPHKELSGQILEMRNTSKKVRVEIRVRRWQPDFPTYETYVEAAECIFKPLLQKYNIKYSSRRRLSIQSKADTTPKLPPKARQAFDYFLIQANKNNLHPNDWENFYHFVWYCSSHNVSVSQEVMQELLIKEEFSEEDAAYLADIFSHGVAIAKLHP